MKQKQKQKLLAAAKRLTIPLSSALFWYMCLVLVGIAALSIGVSVQYGRGYGTIVFGGLCLLGSEVIRRGMSHAA